MTSARQLVRSAAAPTAVSLYVHVPFCVSKCDYCDFHSEAGREGLFSRYVDTALTDVERWARHGLLSDVPTVYFGGGTPTVLGDELVRLVRGVLDAATVREDAEITVETNPETTEPTLITALVECGVNRFSLGVQSFDDAVLRTLGRCHDAARAAAACSALHRSGVPFSLDLICGVPGQTIESWSETLERASQTGALHASVYPLTIEPGTPLAEAVASGKSPEPDPDLAADMMLLAAQSMGYHAMSRYEVASYAYPGHESRHNTVYWTGGAYLGIGPHAASMLPGSLYASVASEQGWGLDAPSLSPPPARVRFSREVGTDEYVADPLRRPEQIEQLTAEEAAREDIMLGMRRVAGVEAERIETAGLTAVLRRLREEGLVELATGPDGRDLWRTTERGWLVGNRVFGAIWNAE
jgi:oxygen-independent coproporphyrinogen III oxidase